ncbi:MULTISPECIES: extracellular solute-binding protein [unclassified Chelatococcus]|uniref:extracellular solute-binding protein n=1 Tax=unclassified Chelatococcus TaxID=2638111 RepID=UPI001BCBBA5A|nr:MULTISPECIES: extracellular solute-binding protein [unclassified Chelatococcus]MBS7700492.1 extracellular solute-binding protein [Chelatococcus sp. YT9]MBX3556288.1 extracellular solute-binding protein [Chelatococcus sp.]
MTHLRGLTWAHTRGFAPLAGLGRVWEDFHPDQQITWDARSLWSFGEEPLERYLDEYDFFVFDYPFAGEAIEKKWVLPLEAVLSPELIIERQVATVGPAFSSFQTPDGLAAIPLDVATHVSALRPDLLAELGVGRPSTWNGVVGLARETGRVAMPMRPTGVWGAFLTLCANAGDTPFRRADGAAVDPHVASDALEKLRALARHLDPSCFDTYPVALLNRMATTDEIAYVPLTYGYSSYGLAGYGRYRLRFEDPIVGPNGCNGAILGGAGIGISSRCRHIEEAAMHLCWLTSESIQSTLYVSMGGQPARREAWLSRSANQLTNGFFENTLRSAESAYVRPNRPGFHDLQNEAASLLHQVVVRDANLNNALRGIEDLWQRFNRTLE